MTVRMQVLRDQTSVVNAFTGLQGEFTADTSTNRPHMNDGVTPGGSPLALFSDLTTLLGASLSASNVVSSTGFQSVSALGIACTATAPNLFACRSAAAVFDYPLPSLPGSQGTTIAINKGASTESSYLAFQDNYSGRAQAGTFGTDDFMVRVSPDGSTWVNGLAVAAASGAVTCAYGLTAGASAGMVAISPSVQGTAGAINKLALFGSTYGIGVSGASQDYITAAGSSHTWYSGATPITAMNTANGFYPGTDNLYMLGNGSARWSNFNTVLATIGTLTATNASITNLTNNISTRSVLPAANITYNLGAAGAYWNNVYATFGTFSTSVTAPTISGVTSLTATNASITGTLTTANANITSVTSNLNPSTNFGYSLGTSGVQWNNVYANYGVFATQVSAPTGNFSTAYITSVASNLNPSVNNTYSLGTNSDYWANVYAVYGSFATQVSAPTVNCTALTGVSTGSITSLSSTTVNTTTLNANALNIGTLALSQYSVAQLQSIVPANYGTLAWAYNGCNVGEAHNQTPTPAGTGVLVVWSNVGGIAGWYTIYNNTLVSA
jgi:hypothetical protein